MAVTVVEVTPLATGGGVYISVAGTNTGVSVTSDNSSFHNVASSQPRLRLSSHRHRVSHHRQAVRGCYHNRDCVRTLRQID